MSGVSVTFGFVLALVATSAYSGFIETFDQAGSDPSASIFSTVIASGDGTFVRERLAPSSTVPNTSPALPVNQGGDKELKYFEPSGGTAVSHSYLVTSDAPRNIVSNVVIDGYFAFDTVDPISGDDVGFVTRFDGTSLTFPSDIDAYSAILSIDRASTVMRLRLARIRGNIITARDILGESVPIPISPTGENYHLFFSVIDDMLSASLFRVEEIAGMLVESPIDLLATAGIQETIWAKDSELREGRLGLYAFSRGPTSVLVDDVTLQVPEPATLALLILGIAVIGYQRGREGVRFN